MRLGIYIANQDAHAGGGNTFERVVLRQLSELSSAHTFIVFTHRELNNIPGIRQYILPPVETSSNKVRQSFFDRTVHAIRNRLTGRKVAGLPARVDRIEERTSRMDDLLNFRNNYNNRLNEAVKKERIDLVWFLLPSYVPVQVPFFMTFWDIGHRDHPYFPEMTVRDASYEDREHFCQSVLPRASRIICGTRVLSEALRRNYNIPEERFFLNPLPADFSLSTEEIEYQLPFDRDEPFIFYPAQFWAHKNHFTIINALYLLKSEYHTRVNAVFSGADKGNMDYIKQKTSELGINDQVYFAGYLEDGEVSWLYRQALAMVFASVLGPDNLPPLEAFAHGCPVVIAHIPGVDEQLADIPMKVTPLDPESYAVAIHKLLEEKSLREEMIRSGLEFIEIRRKESYMDRMEILFNEFAKIKELWD